MTSLLSVNEDSWWIVAENSFRALNQVDAIVWTRCADVVLQHDRAPSGRLDDARVVVTGFVDLFPFWISRRHMLLPIRFKTKMSRAHRHDVIEAVATIDVHVLRHWTKPVGGIEIAVAQGVVTTTPQSFVLVLKQDPAEVMVVGTF